ncbi:OmpA/MotB domain-containing protein [Actibacterium atlanticum]|uniref:OmpA/MotB domain-containing protein n=1 Tax=Actibacterium atlanticum TaxID=1461693 RepID=A0A058ZID9_9RHOB|nr:OmpA family protein [Actibacterium atlanticum]KCV81379.1 OmpA/MotB domain-containing protein [Actibacterium atlanticum]
MRTTYTLPAVLVGALALSACTDVDSYNPDENARTKEGALLGAIAGAVAVGAATEDAGSALLGGVIGGALGAYGGAQLDAQARDLEQRFGNDAITVSNTGGQLVVTMPQDILFAIDSAALNVALEADLAILADSLNKYDQSAVEIIGHTDNTGSAGYNATLSLDRAQAVADVLVNNGVSVTRLDATGRGEEQPVASNLSEEGRAQNRRVEIVITPYS